MGYHLPLRETEGAAWNLIVAVDFSPSAPLKRKSCFLHYCCGLSASTTRNRGCCRRLDRCCRLVGYCLQLPWRESPAFHITAVGYCLPPLETEGACRRPTCCQSLVSCHLPPLQTEGAAADLLVAVALSAVIFHHSKQRVLPQTYLLPEPCQLSSSTTTNRGCCLKPNCSCRLVGCRLQLPWRESPAFHITTMSYHPLPLETEGSAANLIVGVDLSAVVFSYLEEKVLPPTLLLWAIVRESPGSHTVGYRLPRLQT